MTDLRIGFTEPLHVRKTVREKSIDVDLFVLVQSWLAQALSTGRG